MSKMAGIHQRKTPPPYLNICNDLIAPDPPSCCVNVEKKKKKDKIQRPCHRLDKLGLGFGGAVPGFRGCKFENPKVPTIVRIFLSFLLLYSEVAPPLLLLLLSISKDILAAPVL